MSNYAPGPWVVQGIEVLANHAGESVRVATVHGDHESNWNGSRKIAAIRANARLIAAAPELLDACRCALADLEGIAGDLPGDHPAYLTIKELRAAIEKATGAAA